jgi:hypothetical protein
LQTESEVRHDEQLNESLTANRNIEDTQHDFTIGEQIMTEPEQSSQETRTNYCTQNIHPMKTL